MSSAISGFGFAELGQLTARLTQTKKNFDVLSQQASSGMISNTYAGLNGSTAVALTLSTQIDSLTTAQGNIAAASGPAQVTQTAMAQISSIAAGLLAIFFFRHGDGAWRVFPPSVESTRPMMAARLS